MVEQTARRTDDYLNTEVQGPDLSVNRLSAIHRQCFHFFVETDLGDLFRHLQRQLARRCHNQRLDLTQVLHPFHDGNPKGSSLSCSCLGLSDNVFAFHDRRDRLGLNRRGLFKTHGLNGRHDLMAQGKTAKKPLFLLFCHHC